MIIRITVKDNDFTEKLKHLAACMVGGTIDRLLKKPDLKEFFRFESIMNPNITEKPNFEQKAFIEKCLLDTLKEGFITDEYILKNLSLKIVDVYRDRWENGEVLYYFTREKIFLNN